MDNLKLVIFLIPLLKGTMEKFKCISQETPHVGGIQPSPLWTATVVEYINNS